MTSGRIPPLPEKAREQNTSPIGVNRMKEEKVIASPTKTLIANLASQLRFKPIHLNDCTESDIIDLDWTSVVCLVHFELEKGEWYENETGHIVDICNLMDLKNHEFLDRIKDILVELSDVSKWLEPSVFEPVSQIYELPIKYNLTSRLQYRLGMVEETY